VPVQAVAAEKGAAVKSNKSSIAKAQEQLRSMGYYTGKIDGIAGPFTQSAVRNFQRERKLPITGKLDNNTLKAIDTAYSAIIASLKAGGNERLIVSELAKPSPPVKNIVMRLSSRFGTIDFVNVGSSAEKKYSVELNGAPVSVLEPLPIVGGSKVYQAGDTDAFIITGYDVKGNFCQYRHVLFVLNKAGYNIVPVKNCTREYTLQVNNGSLFIIFSEKDNSRAVGTTWRFDGRSLYKL